MFVQFSVEQRVCVCVCDVADLEAEQQSSGEQDTASDIVTCTHGS